MSVEDVNLALTVLNADKVYGLLGAERGARGPACPAPQPPGAAAGGETGTGAGSASGSRAAAVTVSRGPNRVDLGTIC